MRLGQRKAWSWHCFMLNTASTPALRLHRHIQEIVHQSSESADAAVVHEHKTSRQQVAKSTRCFEAGLGGGRSRLPAEAQTEVNIASPSPRISTLPTTCSIYPHTCCQHRKTTLAPSVPDYQPPAKILCLLFGLFVRFVQVFVCFLIIASRHGLYAALQLAQVQTSSQ